MAETKITIEIFRKKDAEDFTKALSDPECRAETGSGAAMTGALASAFLLRAASVTAAQNGGGERLDYIMRNGEILRSYLVRLIDEDVKARGPLRRARKEGDPRALEAAGQTAGAVCMEIVAMMEKCLELCCELADSAAPDARHFLCESAEFAFASVRTAMSYCIYWGDHSEDDIRRYVIRRENELQLQEIRGLYDRTLEKLS